MGWRFWFAAVVNISQMGTFPARLFKNIIIAFILLVTESGFLLSKRTGTCISKGRLANMGGSVFENTCKALCHRLHILRLQVRAVKKCTGQDFSHTCEYKIHKRHKITILITNSTISIAII